MNQGKWFARFNIIFQSWRVFIDLICLPFALVVLITVCRAPPAITELLTKKSQPCSDDPSLTIKRLAIEMNGRPTVRRSTLRLHFECTPVDGQHIDLSTLRLRVGGKNGLWDNCKSTFGRYVTDRLKSWWPIILLPEVNLDVSNLTLQIHQASRARLKRMGRMNLVSEDNNNATTNNATNDAALDDRLRVPSIGDNLEEKNTGVVDELTSIPMNEMICFTVDLFLPNSKQDLLEKCNALGPGHTFSFQIENGNTNLICSTLPIRELLNACQREDLVDMDTPLASLADTVVLSSNNNNNNNNVPIAAAPLAAVQQPPTTTAIPEVLNILDLQNRSNVARNRGDWTEYFDMRDSWAEIFFLTFCSLLSDLFVSIVAIVVLVVAPWRFIAMVYRLCEPRRRLPLRIANRYLNRISDSFDLDFNIGREKFVLAANEASKERKRNLDLVRNTSTDGEAALLLYLSPGSDLNDSSIYKSAKRRLRRHSTAIDKWTKRIENEVRTGPAGFQSLPYLHELKTYHGLKDAELYYTAMNMQLNRARMCGVFPSTEQDRSNDSVCLRKIFLFPFLFYFFFFFFCFPFFFVSFLFFFFFFLIFFFLKKVPCLVEELRNAHDKFHSTVSNASNTVLYEHALFQHQCLSDTRFNEWGVWHKKEGEAFNLVNYYLQAGFQDW